MKSLNLDTIMCGALVASTLLFLPGCKSTYWPEYGTGGMAERYTDPVGEELLVNRYRLQWLREAGGDDCLPGHMIKAKHAENRGMREHQSGMIVDAALTARFASDNLKVLETQLQHMTESGECLPTIVSTREQMAVEFNVPVKEVEFEGYRTNTYR